MKFNITGKNILQVILFIHLGLALFDLRFLILPWIYIGFHLWALATIPFGAQWVPANMDKVRRVLEMADMKSGEVLYDLGSGDGRIVVEAARVYNAKAIGIEIDPIRVLISRLKLRLHNLDKNAQIKHANFFNVNLSNANVVTAYLLPKTVNKLKSKFKRELKSGSRIVSLQFPLKNWKPVKLDNEYDIFVYKI